METIEGKGTLVKDRDKGPMKLSATIFATALTLFAGDVSRKDISSLSFHHPFITLAFWRRAVIHRPLTTPNRTL